MLTNKRSFQIFHDNSRNNRAIYSDPKLADPNNWPKEWTEIEEKIHPRLLNIELPKEDISIDMKLIQAIHLRSSSKSNIKDNPLRLIELSSLLRNSINSSKSCRAQDIKISRRVYPSAGGRFPLECYIVVNNVEGLEKGLYHYELSKHSLAQMISKDMEKEVKEIFNNGIDNSRAIIIITSVTNRNTIKYGERGYRFSLLEAGHLMQNICLISTALGIPMSPIGGFVDVLVSRLLDLEETREIPIYSCVLP